MAGLIRARQEAADRIERLLAFLDETDGDCDLEDQGEPTDAEIRLSASRYMDNHEDDEDGADGEPWLGSLEPDISPPVEYEDRWLKYTREGDQTRFHNDREDDGGDLEPSLCGVTASAVPCHSQIGNVVEDAENDDDLHDDDLEREPSLGWTPLEAAVGSRVAEVGRVDLEEQCENEGDYDTGIADSDGLLEQCSRSFGSGFASHVE